MRFSGRFADSLLTEQLDRVSLSFLVEDLQIRRGGIAPNICFGLAALGLDPLLNAFAFTTALLVRVITPVYTVDACVGLEPLVV